MKNLILADLKVLGHRLWTVPLMALVLVALVYLIPGLEMPDPVRNFMIALLAPCLLIFELFREDQKRGSESLIMTMPVNKNIYVLAKYTTVIILGITTIPAGWLATLFTNTIQTGNFSFTESLSFLSNMLKIMAFVIPIVYFVIPIYFFIRKIIISALIGIVFTFYFSERILTFFYEHFYVSVFDDNLHLMFYLIGLILIPASVIHLVNKFWVKKIPDDAIRTVWFALIFILFLFVFEILMRNLQFADYYIRIVAALDSSEGEKREIILQIIKNLRLYFPVISIALITIGSWLFIIRRKSSQKFFQNAVLYIFAPLTIIIVSDKIAFLVGSFFEDGRLYYFTNLFTLIISLSMITIVSYKSSVYLLKNNRRLS
ncbi:MAG: ABC-2 transporter permease [Candidatus Delongbacteria bacterium]|nr:ABC-2 transporter permease [Candidatus Delongbacteria bacterium]